MQKWLLVFVVLIFGVNLIGNNYGLYLTTHLDIPMHMAGGAWVALIFFYIFQVRFKDLLPKNKLAKFIFAVSFVALVGVGWEFFEYLVSTLLKHDIPFGCMTPNGLFDTLKDLFDDLVGGAIASLIWLW